MSSPAPEDSSTTGGQLVLDADTDAAFMAMMRDIHARSGLTGGQVSIFSDIPRSTVYRYIDPKTTALPRSRDYVEAFARACRLNNIQVNRVLWLWDNLNTNAEIVTGDQAVEIDLVVPGAHGGPTRSGAPVPAVVVHGNYNVYTPRAQAQPDDDFDTDQAYTDDDDGAGEDSGERGRGSRGSGGGSGGPRGRAHRGKRGDSEFSRLLLTVLSDSGVCRRMIVLIIVIFVGFLALILCLHLIGVSDVSMGMAVLGLSAGLTGIIGRLSRRRRKAA